MYKFELSEICMKRVSASVWIHDGEKQFFHLILDVLTSTQLGGSIDMHAFYKYSFILIVKGEFKRKGDDFGDEF